MPISNSVKSLRIIFRGKSNIEQGVGKSINKGVYKRKQ